MNFCIWAPRVFRGVLKVTLFGLVLTGTAAATDRPGQGWGFGWDNGLTVRRWVAQDWELSVAAGPNDYLVKNESLKKGDDDVRRHHDRDNQQRPAQRPPEGWIGEYLPVIFQPYIHRFEDISKSYVIKSEYDC